MGFSAAAKSRRGIGSLGASSRWSVASFSAVAGADGQSLSSDKMTVGVLPSIQSFSVLPATIIEGDTVQLKWTTLDAESVTITRDDGAQYPGNPSGETSDHPPPTVSNYAIAAHNATGDSVASATSVAKIKVQPQPPVDPLPPLQQQSGL